MKLSHYIYLWISLTLILAIEHWALGHFPGLSFLHHVQTNMHLLKGTNLSPDAGRPFSYALGWIGIITILLTNLYLFRKYFALFRGVGNLANWLNFHIFCGLLGPSCILFHCDFKVRGLVGISFWSMMVVALSGIIGRYIYVQILRQEKSSTSAADAWAKRLDDLRVKSAQPISDEAFIRLKSKALEFVGLPPLVDSTNITTTNKPLLGTLFNSLVGDARLIYNSPAVIPGMPPETTSCLIQYAIAERRVAFLEPFRRMLGYWHTFHLPFAFFMYIAAFIHIGAALMFGISN